MVTEFKFLNSNPVVVLRNTSDICHGKFLRVYQFSPDCGSCLAGPYPPKEAEQWSPKSVAQVMSQAEGLDFSI